MFLSFWRVLTVALTAVSLGAAFAHLLELPAKLSMTGEMWLRLLQTLYPPLFGTVGAFAEVGAMVAAVVLAVLLRGHGTALTWSVIAAVCLISEPRRVLDLGGAGQCGAGTADA